MKDMGERTATIRRPSADTVVSVPREAGQELPDVIEVVFPAANRVLGAGGAAEHSAASPAAGRRTAPAAALSTAPTGPVAVGADV